MTQKAGRNDPCPCGSGRKYKKCCLTSIDEAEFQYRHWRQVESQLIPELLSFALETLGPEALTDAWSEFYDHEPDDDFDPESPMNMVFMPWFFFNWDYDAAAPIPEVIAESFLAEYELNSDEQKFLSSCIRAPYSLCEVVEVMPGVGLILFDLLGRSKYEVVERLASQTLKKGEIIYCATTQLDGVGSNVGTGPYALRPTAKREILALRRWIIGEEGGAEITVDTLDVYEATIRQFYLDSVKSMFTPPQLTNTDKDPLLPQKLYFDIASAERTFHALKDLAEGVPEERLRAESVSTDGILVKAEIPWFGGREEARKRLGGPVILGTINIDHEKLIVEVNSTSRAERIREIIEERLRDEVTYKTTLLEPIESELEKLWATAAAARTYRGTAEWPNSTADSGLRSPADMPAESRAKLAESARLHWDSWIDLPVPALNNMTPREATKTEEGRDLLESLLLELESRADGSDENLLQPDIAKLRRELGLLS